MSIVTEHVLLELDGSEQVDELFDRDELWDDSEVDCQLISPSHIDVLVHSSLDLDVLTDLVEVLVECWLLLCDERLHLFECQLITYSAIHLQFWSIPQLLGKDHILDILLEHDRSVLFPWEPLESEIVECKTEFVKRQEMRLSVRFLEDEVRCHAIH